MFRKQFLFSGHRLAPLLHTERTHTSQHLVNHETLNKQRINPHWKRGRFNHINLDVETTGVKVLAKKKNKYFLANYPVVTDYSEDDI